MPALKEQYKLLNVRIKVNHNTCSEVSDVGHSILASEPTSIVSAIVRIVLVYMSAVSPS